MNTTKAMFDPYHQSTYQCSPNWED